jgi:hypothetical protein
LEAEEKVDSILVDLLFELINLLVVGDGVGAEIIVPIKQATNGTFKGALGQSGHHEDIIAQGSERFVERSQNMSLCDHPKTPINQTGP